METLDIASAVQLIGSLLVHEANSLCGVEQQVQGLQEELEFMQQYLQNADARDGDREVTALVRHVRKLAYDAEDVIDTFILKVRRRDGNRLVRFAYLIYNYPQRYQVREQIQILQTSLKRVSDKLNSHGVARIASLDGCPRPRPRSYPYEDSDAEFVVGIEEDIRKLVDVVMGEGRTRVGVIAIVGMGGSGKTTSARKVYNHRFAKECFDCSAWVCISQEWSTQHILSEIFRKVGGHEQPTTKMETTPSVEELVDKTRNILKKKSFLVVLDDVWSKEALEEILPALPRGGSVNNGSKIIITTRNREIIRYRLTHQEHLYIHEPQPLTEELSWELFSKIALSHRKNYDEESFKSVGKDMLRKCDGLPLAVVALAGILNTRETIGEWHQVAETVRSRIMEGTCESMYGRVGELLALSYDDLPYDLKPCFLYLGVFPEDCQISVGVLTRMWIAEGLVSSQNTGMSLEDVALQRVEELSHRFMIQVVKSNFKGMVKAIRIHDLLRDLSVQKAKENSFLQIYSPFGITTDSTHVPTLAMQPRRAAVHSSTALPAHISHLRSLILLAKSSILHPSYSTAVTVDFRYVSQNFKLLRVLSIWGIKTVSGILPKQIGCLIHLRYLAIRATNIIALPNTIKGLRNLLTLDYRDVDLGSNLEKKHVKIKIPDAFHELALLRHLFLPIECPWSVKELKLSSMRNLRTLWGVRIDNNSHCLLTEFPKLSTTLKKLQIVVSSESELKAAFSCPSLMNDVLHTFHCDLRDGSVLRKVGPLRPMKHLLKLTLIGKIEMTLSLVLPVNLIRLELKDSMIRVAAHMESLGELAHLKRLSLSNAYVGSTLSCGSCSFPQLEELNIENLPFLDNWEIKKGAMPCLKKLDITRCRRLMNFPLGLSFITTLKKFELNDMPKAFCRQATECGWARTKLTLPYNFASIIKHSDSPFDSSSIQKVYEQLTRGVFLDNKAMKYWVTKENGIYSNCFMVYASLLCISLQPDVGTSFKEVIESSEDGVMVSVAKLKSPTSSGFVYYRVAGRFDIGNLSLEADYKINWIIMFVCPGDSEHSAVSSSYNHQGSTSRKIEGDHFQGRHKNKLFVDKMERAKIIETTLSGREVHSELIFDNRINEWIRVPGGLLETHPTMDGEVELSLSCQMIVDHLDLIVKGFIIQPKW